MCAYIVDGNEVELTRRKNSEKDIISHVKCSLSSVLLENSLGFSKLLRRAQMRLIESIVL